MQSIRLRAIIYQADFRKNEVSLYEEFRRNKKRFPGELKAGEAYLFVSKEENQLIWFVAQPDAKLETATGKPIHVVQSIRWRMNRASWNPKMLANYARASNIKLAGIKDFETAYREERERKAQLSDILGGKPKPKAKIKIKKKVKTLPVTRLHQVTSMAASAIQ